MTAPRIVRTGAVISDGRDVEIGGGDSLHLVLLATADETEDARALDGQRVRITIEPEEATHGSPLDYLAEMKGIMQGALDGYAISEQTERALRRCMSLANTVSLAIAAERRMQP
jgi:hypothetical protein